MLFGRHRASFDRLRTGGAWSIEHRDKAGKARKARKGRAEDRGKVSLRYQVSGVRCQEK